MQMILLQLSLLLSQTLLLVNLGIFRIGHLLTGYTLTFPKERPGTRIKIPPQESFGIKQIHTVKLLGVWFSDSLSFASHIDDNTVSSVSQRFYLLKQLKIRGLNQVALDIVFQSLVMNKITYAAQS